MATTGRPPRSRARAATPTEPVEQAPEPEPTAPEFPGVAANLTADDVAGMRERLGIVELEQDVNGLAEAVEHPLDAPAREQLAQMTEEVSRLSAYLEDLVDQTRPVQRSLHHKLGEVLAAIDRVPKTGWNDFHRYSYATEADVADLIRKELGNRHVTLMPEYHSHRRDEHHVTGSGKEQWLHYVTLRLTFIDGESGERETTDGWLGVGIDGEDKGFYKAMTGAMKYALMKTFMVSTGDDPENDSGDTREAATGAGAAPRAPRSGPRSGSGTGKGERPAWTKEPATDGQRRMLFAKARDAELGVDENNRDWRDRLVAYKTAGEVKAMEQVRRGDIDDVKAAIAGYDKDPDRAKQVMSDYFAEHPDHDPWGDDFTPAPVAQPTLDDDDDIPFGDPGDEHDEGSGGYH